MNRDKISSFLNIFLGLKFLQPEAFETGMERKNKQTADPPVSWVSRQLIFFLSMPVAAVRSRGRVQFCHSADSGSFRRVSFIF
jgi:hypothetical protein